jgi:methionyl-tRNA formyltransferase
MRNLEKEPVQTLFLGTDWESLETLRSLLEDKRYNIVGVITTPDKPVGRKQIMTPSKVKEYALEHNIPVFHTERNPDRYQKALDTFKPELIVCKAFGEIVPKFFIEYPKYKAINVHFSILPKYRGAVPIQKAILDGETETGITIMLMSEGMDEGDILEIFPTPIQLADSNLSLRERLVSKSAQVLGDVLERWVQGSITSTPQDHTKATYCYQKDISKENAEIKWDTMEPVYIERMIRAFIPWPIAWFIHDGKIYKIYESEIINTKNTGVPGELFKQNDMLLVSTKDPDISLRIKRLQIEGKNEMSEKDYLNGLGRNI